MRKNYHRRKFIKAATMLTAGLNIFPSALKAGEKSISGNPVRLGGPLPKGFDDPGEWAKAVKSLRYSAAYCPLKPGAPSEQIKSFRKEAEKNNILIAEAGVWNNMLDKDEAKRKDAIEKNIATLQLADEIGAICCINISGATGDRWKGPYQGNYPGETFDMIVETVRYIVDHVKPLKAFYVLESMPYMLPDSPDTYLELIKAINRRQFAAHLDVVNMISSPQKYFKNSSFIKECFMKMGSYIKSIHAKDITIVPKLTVHLDECRPGTGTLDYATFLKETSKLKDVPFMLEHLNNQAEYLLAAEYVRLVAKKEGIPFMT